MSRSGRHRREARKEKRGVLAHLQTRSRASMSERGAGGAQEKLKRERKAARRRSAQRPCYRPSTPRMPPPRPQPAAWQRCTPARKSRARRTRRAMRSLEKARRWLRRKAPLPAADPHGRRERRAGEAGRLTVARRGDRAARRRAARSHRADGRAAAAGRVRRRQAVPPIPAPHVNGGGRPGNGAAPPHALLPRAGRDRASADPRRRRPAHGGRRDPRRRQGRGRAPGRPDRLGADAEGALRGHERRREALRLRPRESSSRASSASSPKSAASAAPRRAANRRTAKLDAAPAGVVKLVDTRRSGRRGRKPMGVRVPPPALADCGSTP